jgi:hypothetical protein
MSELLCHLWGDYLLQNDWLDNQKLKSIWVAMLHAFLYSLPFLLLTRSIIALLIIFGTHAIIDRYRIAAQFTKLANWKFDGDNGFAVDRPVWLTTWLIIIIDNTMHLTINHFALLIKS